MSDSASDSAPDDAPDSGAEQRRRRREGRRARAREGRFDTTIASPCIQVCQIDDASGCCIGCLRAIDEIREWPIMTASEKTKVLENVAARRAAQAGPDGHGG